VARIGGALRSGSDLLNLVAHGAMIEGTPRLWLERNVGDHGAVHAGTLWGAA
jgi:hypothetical protein